MSTPQAALTDGPHRSFNVVLEDDRFALVINDIEFDESFDLRKATAVVQSEFDESSSQDSLEAKLVDLFAKLIAPDAGLSALDGPELSERLGAVMKLLEPHLLRAVRSDTSNEGIFMSTINTVARERRVRNNIAGFDYGID